MAVEEIVLSLPESTPEPELRRLSATERDRNHNDELIGRYRQMLDARRRFVWTRRGRASREEVFEAACKNMAKQLARQSTEKVQDRASRLAARALIYGAVDGLLATAAREQQRQAAQYRKALSCAFWLGSIGALMVAVLIALSLNGLLTLNALA